MQGDPHTEGTRDRAPQLVAARRRFGWSQSELGRRSGVNQTTISMIENGRLRPYQSQLHKLAQALGWPLERADELLAAGRGEGADGE